MKAIVTNLLVLCATGAGSAMAQDFPEWMFERKIQGENNLESIKDAQDSDAYDWTQAVARVEFVDDGAGFCTASRVAKDLFLTNAHCAVISCDNIQFTMGYQADINENDRQTFRCKELVRKNLNLDYALYRVTPVSGPEAQAEVDYPLLPLWAGSLTEGLELIVAGHPSGRLKEVDRSEECVLASAEVTKFALRQTIKHMCDTEGGSSGSPVLDAKTGYAVALHWGGHAGESNFAIPMYLIVDDLSSHIEEEDLLGLQVVYE